MGIAYLFVTAGLCCMLLMLVLDIRGIKRDSTYLNIAAMIVGIMIGVMVAIRLLPYLSFVQFKAFIAHYLGLYLYLIGLHLLIVNTHRKRTLSKVILMLGILIQIVSDVVFCVNMQSLLIKYYDVYGLWIIYSTVIMAISCLARLVFTIILISKKQDIQIKILRCILASLVIEILAHSFLCTAYVDLTTDRTYY